MLKMFSTQLSGLFKKLQDHEEFSMEDAARLLAQAKVGEGTIFLYGTKEMAAIPLEAINGAEPLTGAVALDPDQLENLSVADRVLLVARDSTDVEAVTLAQSLVEKEIPFVAVSTVSTKAPGGLDALADVHIDLRMKKGMLPTETGERTGLPTSMAALFIYYGIKFTIDEILAEYEE
jgi:uncharacterized phosphosugar-binding protein